MAQTTKNSMLIKATAEKLYQAVTDAKAIVVWQVPGDMVGKIHSFDLREGGGYEMSLFYPAKESEIKGKTSTKEDKFKAKFVELTPFRKIIEAINFESDNPDFSGEMLMEVTFEPSGTGTNVTFLFKNIPMGIKPEDNEKGTISSLKKLAKYVK